MTYSRAIKNFLLLLILTIFASGCGGIKFNPDFYVGDYLNNAVVNEKGEFIFADTPAFNGMACLTEEKVKELREILIRARMPKEAKKKMYSTLSKLNRVKIQRDKKSL